MQRPTALIRKPTTRKQARDRSLQRARRPGGDHQEMWKRDPGQDPVLAGGGGEVETRGQSRVGMAGEREGGHGQGEGREGRGHGAG